MLDIRDVVDDVEFDLEKSELTNGREGRYFDIPLKNEFDLEEKNLLNDFNNIADAILVKARELTEILMEEKGVKHFHPDIDLFEGDDEVYGGSGARFRTITKVRLSIIDK